MDENELTALQRDAELTRALRKARLHGASIQLGRPGQSVQIVANKVTPDDSKAIQAAFPAVFVD